MFNMAGAAYKMIVVRKEVPEPEWKAGLRRRKYALADQRVLNYKWGDDDVWAGAVLVKMNSVGDKRGKAVGLLEELCELHEGRLHLALMAYRNSRVW